ncbi:regulator of volume decrease after cellular swelling-domain-containing protein [Boeremia exigua]|uniref:regulator of volume decrease after cellular swelling-domain-containing protein n=1 Tax=Boeremia exigua TaxID=749465 RepID=UPI001E8E3342|nr:regulator of volume decrease after cellular swelling-domain-containing protein [Boeremia exigua]KAH6638942.1 regulator of volume decrease after cellular swelling-domain-containing protein [Boeremia exigua]
MSIRHLETAPQASDFTPLQEHQEQTPATFFGAKPVTYASYSGVTLSAPSSQLQQDPVFAKFSTTTDGDETLIKDVDIWVTSESLIFFQTAPTPTGAAITYPTVALHATMKWRSTIEALYMSLSLNDADTVNDEEDIQSLELTVLPPNYATAPDGACIKDIFSAMNTCADLHPDPNDDDEGDNIEDDLSAPGASGWITAENMDQYVDEDGNFNGMVLGEELGPGAGTVRQRDDTEAPNGVNGDEVKWSRTG